MKKIAIVIFLLNCSFGYLYAQSYKFDFGHGNAKKGFIQVTPHSVYSSEAGFGFDYGTQPASEVYKWRNKLTGDYCTSTKPFYFSVNLPEGNYDVTVTLGKRKDTSNTTVKAESRRLMLRDVTTGKNQMVKHTFTVNVRTPQISATESIRIKPREKGYLNWDNKLTLEFGGDKPSVAAVEIVPNTSAITLFLAGNSTVVDQDKEPWAAWGQMIPYFFAPGKVVVANYAESGEALNSFVSSKRLAKILSLIKPGDYLFIEFGHNDQKQSGEGIGPWDSYTNYLKQYVTQAREKGANAVLVTSMHRRRFNEQKQIENTLGDYPAAVRKVAADLNVPLIDLNNMSKVLYEALGPDESIKAFVHYPANTWPGQTTKLEDNTHFSTYGAYQIAQCIVQGIRDLNLDIAAYIKPAIPVFNPAQPDNPNTWQLSISPMAENIKPDGN